MKKIFAALLIGFLSLPYLHVKASDYSVYNFPLNKSLILRGSQENEQFGSSIAIFDLNKDGFEDLVIGSPYYSESDKQKRGKVEVYLGPINQNTSTADFTIIGANDSDLLGTSISYGDVNDDSYQDLIIGAPGALKEPNNRTGATYVFLGNSHFFLQKYDYSLYQPDLTVYGPHNNAYFGLSVLGYDIDNDHNVDIVSSAPLAKNDDDTATGNVYVVSWDSEFVTDPMYNLAEIAPKIFIPGEHEGGLFGSALAKGNFDSNSSPDLVVSAYAYSDTEKAEVGAAYVFLNFSPNSSYRKKPDNIFTGEGKNQWFGFNLNTVQLNNDKYDDLAISSFSFKENLKTAKIWLINGSSAIRSNLSGISNLPPLSHRVIEGSSHNIMLGSSVITEDLNRNGEKELIVSAPNISSTAESNVYIYKAQDFLKDRNIPIYSEIPVQEIKSGQTGDWFGQKITIADFNRDGLKDLAITAPMAEKNNISRVGAVHVLMQTETTDSTITTDNGESAMTSRTVSRGEGVSLLMKKFDFASTFSDFITSCYNNLDFCFFVFSSQSKYDDIRFKPDVILYPDVPSRHPYYKDITLATMLGLINGNLSDPESPFKPDLSLSRIQALKLIIEASTLERNNFFTEIMSNMGGDSTLAKFQPIYTDVKSDVPHMWWYYKYINFAYQLGILEQTPTFRPDDAITEKEFTDLLNNMYQFAR